MTEIDVDAKRFLKEARKSKRVGKALIRVEAALNRTAPDTPEYARVRRTLDTIWAFIAADFRRLCRYGPLTTGVGEHSTPCHPTRCRVCYSEIIEAQHRAWVVQQCATEERV